MREASRDALGLFVSCVAAVGFLAGWSPLHAWLNGGPGLMLLIGALLGAILFVLTNNPLSGRLVLSLIGLLVMGGLAFGLTFGIMWYFTTYLPASGQPLFQFNLTSPTPSHP